LLLQLLLLRISLRDRIGAEGQHTAELTGYTANGIAYALLAECAADSTAQWLPDLAEQIAEPSLR